MSNESRTASYIKMDGHYTEPVAGGVSVGYIRRTLILGNGGTVEFPLPFIPIGNDVGIAPLVMPDGANELRINLAYWSPVHYGRDVVALFPFNFSDQTTAVKVARAFDADPTTSWRASNEAITAWLRSWGAQHGIAVP